MKVLRYMKDGGPESRVAGLFVIEIKSWFSIVLLHFWPGSREAYHSHAFNAVSWLLHGNLIEYLLDSPGFGVAYSAGWRPIRTPRDRFHKVVSAGHSWVLSFRGPWAATWREFLPSDPRFITLTHGRRVVA